MTGFFQRFRPGGGDRQALQLIGAPAIPPSQRLVDDLTYAIEEHEDVAEGYLFQTAGMGADAVSDLAVGLVLDSNRGEESFARICDAIVARLESRSIAQPLVFQELSVDARAAVRRAVPPIFIRPT